MNKIKAPKLNITLRAISGLISKTFTKRHKNLMDTLDWLS